MSTDSPRGFLAALAAGADLDQALSVSAPPRRRARPPPREPVRGTLGKAMAHLPSASVVALVCDHASQEDRPAVAQRLLEVWAPPDDHFARVRRALEAVIGLMLAGGSAIFGLYLIVYLRVFLPDGLTMAPLDQRMLSGGAALLIVSLLLIVTTMARRVDWDALLARRVSPDRLLLLISAGLDAGLSPYRVLRSLDQDGIFRAPRRWWAELRDETTPAAELLARRGYLSGSLVPVVNHRWPDEPAGGPWARAAAASRRTASTPWRPYVALGLSTVGVGLVVVAAWRTLIRLGDFWP